MADAPLLTILALPRPSQWPKNSSGWTPSLKAVERWHSEMGDWTGAVVVRGISVPFPLWQD